MINYFVNKYRRHKFCKEKKIIKKHFDISKNVIFMPSIHLDMRFFKERCGIIGERSIIGCNFVFESDKGYVFIGERTYIGGGTNLISRSKIEIGNDVTIGWNCNIYDHDSHSINWENRAEDIRQQYEDINHGRNFITNKNWDGVKTLPIKICDKVWLGFNVIILKGVTIGEGAIVGAGTVVAKDVEPWTIVVGNPARVIKKIVH